MTKGKSRPANIISPERRANGENHGHKTQKPNRVVKINEWKEIRGEKKSTVELNVFPILPDIKG